MISKNDLFGCVNRWRSGDIYTLASFCRLPRVCLGREPSSGRLSAFRPADIGTRQISRRRFLSLFFFWRWRGFPFSWQPFQIVWKNTKKVIFCMGTLWTRFRVFVSPNRRRFWALQGYLAGLGEVILRGQHPFHAFPLPLSTSRHGNGRFCVFGPFGAVLGGLGIGSTSFWVSSLSFFSANS